MFNSRLRSLCLQSNRRGFDSLASKLSFQSTPASTAHHITTHDENGKAIFTSKPLSAQKKLPIPIGDISIISSTHSFPLDLSSEADIDQYQHDRISPFFPGTRRICPDGGTATCIMSMKPGVDSALHRTMTLDTLVIIEGELEITLDSGETQILKAGDSLVQRATMHKWKNVTPNNGWARWVVFIQAVAEPVRVGNHVLGHEWAH
jgi:mannose-6-phosphate isomerase-like protein (cupin superfamily)